MPPFTIIFMFQIHNLNYYIFNVNLQWLETGAGEMFYTDTEKEIEEIISLYRRLNPFFKKFIIRQLRDLIEYK